MTEDAESRLLNDFGRLMDACFNHSRPTSKRHSFAILLFNITDPDDVIHYISNATREQAIAALKEFILAMEKHNADGPLQHQQPRRA